MRGLAQFVMGGRYRALLVAMASSGSLLFGWIGAAVVGLVTLRRGYAEGFQLLLWALLPALLATQLTGDSSQLALLLGTGALAMLLRATVSLSLAALGSAAVALLTGLGLLLFGESLLAELARLFEEFFNAVAEQARQSGSDRVRLQPPTQLQLAGMMGTANGALSFLCLALARYWQAALYNPGGFGAEFRQLRFPPALVGAIALAALGIAALGLSYRSWAAALLLPLTVAGFALLHARARQRGQSRFWLGGLYVAWVVFDAVKLALLALVAVDALVDFRRRWGLPPAGGTAEPGDSDAGQDGPAERGGDGAGEGDPEDRGGGGAGQDDAGPPGGRDDERDPGDRDH